MRRSLTARSALCSPCPAGLLPFHQARVPNPSLFQTYTFSAIRYAPSPSTSCGTLTFGSVLRSPCTAGPLGAARRTVAISRALRLCIHRPMQLIRPPLPLSVSLPPTLRCAISSAPPDAYVAFSHLRPRVHPRFQLRPTSYAYAPYLEEIAWLFVTLQPIHPTHRMFSRSPVCASHVRVCRASPRRLPATSPLTLFLPSLGPRSCNLN